MRPSINRLSVEALESRLALSNYFVSTAGNDNNPGTDALPWRTLQRAADVVNPGDLVTVRPGNYTGFDLRRDGTAASRITFRADQGVVINARNSRTTDGINLEDADFVTLDNFTLSNASGSISRAGIRAVNAEFVHIRNNRADGMGRWGILTGFCDDLLIENNVMSRSVAEHGIYVSNSGDRPTIRNNVSWGNRANGIHMNGDVSLGGDGIISNALVEGNIIYDNGVGGGSGINCDGVQNSVIRNNLIYNTHASGISLYRIDGGGGSTGNLVVNNTVLVASDGRWAMNIMDGSTGNTLRNNIFYNSHSFRGSISVSANSLPGLVSNYNVGMDRFSTDGGGTRITLAQWRTATGQDANTRLSTPTALFVNPGANDYHLKAGSPAIDNGTSQQAPAVDLEGRARPSGVTWDVGAYEYASAGNRPPVATADSATVAEDNLIDVAVLANDSDPDGNPLSVLSVTQPAHGTAAINANGTVRYTPAANYNGADSFTYTIGDGQGGTATATVSVNVTAVNDVPLAVNDAATTPAGTPVVVAVLANDTDTDGDVLSVSTVSQGANGTVAINANGTVTYTPAAGFSGADAFTYTVSDGRGGSATANVAITVNTPPSGTNRKYDFGTATSPVATGYTRVTAATTYNAALGYGWTVGAVQARDRNRGGDLNRDFNQTRDATFAVDLPAGTYTVVVTMGDASSPHDQMGVYLEGALVDSVTSARGQYVTRTYTVSVTDGQLTLRLRDLGGSDVNAVINALDITPNAATAFGLAKVDLVSALEAQGHAVGSAEAPGRAKAFVTTSRPEATEPWQIAARSYTVNVTAGWRTARPRGLWDGAAFEVVVAAPVA